MTDAPNPRQQITDKALALGFDTVGFAGADLSDVAREGFAAYLAAGHHGDMGWLEDKADRRQSPRALWPEAKSVIALGLSYAPAHDPLNSLHRHNHGTVSVYAQGRDYHDVVKKKLKALAGWMHRDLACAVKVFVDTAPVMEKPIAQQAGIGWQGKHTNLVSQAHGSWLFLGEIYTDLALEADPPHLDRCGSCTTCQDICPTNAFPEPYKLDARRCISYLTIEHQGPIPQEFRKAIGNRIYGCDDCLAVCPWNKFAAASRNGDLMPRIELTAPRLKELAQLDDTAFRKLFSRSAIKRLGRDRFVRNVLIAIGNSSDPSLATTAETLLSDVSPLVRGAAVWAVRQLLSSADVTGLRQNLLEKESDGGVRNEWLA